jgi:hypothetical protein
MPRHHRIVLSTMVVAFLLLSLLIIPSVTAASTPQLSLVAAASTARIDRYPGEPVFLDLGINLVAGSKPFEVHVKRKSYRDPIVATQIVRPGQTRTLPAGLVQDFGGFSDFLHLTLTNAAGNKVLDRDQIFCPNAFETVRTRPDAPAISPYPQLCGTNPLTLGSIWGLQAGWAINTARSDSDAYVDLPDGIYTAKVRVNQPYQRLFEIPSGQADATVKVTVRTLDSGVGAASAAPRIRASSDQAAAPEPASRPPLGRSSVPAGHRPDLRPLPAWGISVVSPEEAGVQGAAPQQHLAFNSDVWNAGPSPLVVDGFRRPGTLLMDAYQYFFDTSGNQVGWAPTGTLEYDERDAHGHWHFTDFARYRLLNANKQVAVHGQKEAFCLAPTDAIDLTAPGANWKPFVTDLHSACGTSTAIAIRETLDTGWGDTYDQYLPGQSLDITSVPNGTYYIEIAANPDHRLYERSTRNNVSLRKVILGGTLGNRTVTVPPYQGIDAS